MTGPVNGLGGQAQPQIANTFQPGGTDQQVRAKGQANPQENAVQPRYEAPAQTNNSQETSSKRGSIVDITV